MKTSVLIIAHNEEKHIAACIAAVLDQSIKPYEVVVVAHNCTDRTEEIVKSYASIKLVRYSGPVGPIYARIKGFEVVAGDIVVCLDGDATPTSRTWLESITAAFKDRKVVAVGGVVMLVNNLYTHLISMSFFYMSRFWRRDYHFYFWGANFACRKQAYMKVGGLVPVISLSKKLKLNFIPDDIYLSLALEKEGRVLLVPHAVVTTRIPYKSFSGVKKRFLSHNQDRAKLFAYFGLKK